MRWRKYKTRGVAKGQMNMFGDIYLYDVKYPPRISTSDDGLKVVVTRIPVEHSEFDKQASLDAAKDLSNTISHIPKRSYYFKKYRDEETREKLILLR